ncbi:DapH/DapD/GlmU-related protein [Mobiluncus mulieris]|uniref:DapH/DapD/GlmU-related protein n=1 Tax=Mobiluncus mulieris TaxID=2052 RepID=UPI0020938E61|nr:DapH/DapD/GlmU-related protein [Mobiluncus mulieris]
MTVDEGTTLAGGASTAGTMAIGVHQRVSLGRNCHLGANSGLAIPLGDECVIEPGLYLNADTKVYVMPSGGVIPGETGFFMEPKTLLARICLAYPMLCSVAIPRPDGWSASGGTGCKWNLLTSRVPGLVKRRGRGAGRGEGFAQVFRGSQAKPARGGKFFRPGRGTTAVVKPRRAASARRRDSAVQLRISPVRDTSPKPLSDGQYLTSDRAGAASATAKSTAGSTARAPPTVDT